MENPRSVRGSEVHADRVINMAKDWLRKLSSKNTFKPTVLAKVSHKDRSFIGASIAVSHFLRPICLFNRIIDFKQSLGKAVILFQPLNIPNLPNWSFEAFWKAKYDSRKEPCQNCKMVFYGDRPGASTFLGACAEYCPVNQLLPDEPALWESDDPFVTNLLRRNYSRCSVLFENFRDISDRCIYACQSNNETIIKAVYWEMIHKLHIFGLWPECNNYF